MWIMSLYTSFQPALHLSIRLLCRGDSLHLHANGMTSAAPKVFPRCWNAIIYPSNLTLPQPSPCSLGVEAALLGDAAAPALWLAAIAEAFAAAQAREVEQRETLETRAGNTHVTLLGTQVPATCLRVVLIILIHVATFTVMHAITDYGC